jgi:repressor LexA
MPTSTLTARQKAVLALVEKSVERRGYPPSLRELAAGLGVSSTRGVEKHLAALEKKGALRRGEGARALELSGRAAGKRVPVLGRVAAGAPLLAEENVEEHVTVDPALARHEGGFLLRVKGESMRDAGMLDGDLVLVRPQKDAENGDIVVALVGEEATVKRLYKKKDRLELRPENPSFRPLLIGPGEPHAVLGKVVGLIRTY